MQRPTTPERIACAARSPRAGVIRQLAEIVRSHPGKTPVVIDLVTSVGPKVLALGPDYRVDPTPEFRSAVDIALGWDFVAYLDETHDARSYWLCGVVVSAEAIRPAQAALEKVAVEAAGRCGLADTPELHGYELFQREGAFKGAEPSTRIDIYSKALDALMLANPTIVLRGVETDRIRFQHPHRVAWRYALESIDELEAPGLTLVVADRHEETEAALRVDTREYIESGTGGWKPRRLLGVKPEPRFFDSTENRLLQAADLVAYLHQRRINQSREADPRSHAAREWLWEKVASAVSVCKLWSQPEERTEASEWLAADHSSARATLPNGSLLSGAPFGAGGECRGVRVKVHARAARAGVIRELAGVVRDFPGGVPVYVDLVTSVGPKLVELGREYRVDPQPDFFAEVRHLLGEAAVL